MRFSSEKLIKLVSDSDNITFFVARSPADELTIYAVVLSDEVYIQLGL
jgi:hypothetical protein